MTSRLLDLIKLNEFTDLDRLNVKITTEGLEQALHMQLVSADAVLALDGNPTKQTVLLISVVAEPSLAIPRLAWISCKRCCVRSLAMGHHSWWSVTTRTPMGS